MLGFESLALSGFAFGLAIEDELKKSNLISCNLIPVAVLRTGQDVSRAFKQVFKTSFSYKEKDNDNVSMMVHYNIFPKLLLSVKLCMCQDKTKYNI